jgi:hypothetical protein
VYPSSTSKKGPGSRSNEQGDRRDTEEEEEELPKSDGSGVLLFSAEQIAECRERQLARVVPMEQV